MSGEFFSNYKDFIMIPIEEQKVKQKDFDPQDYATHYILTLSLYDSLISKWSEAIKYGIEIEKSIDKVFKEFNKSQNDIYHLQLLELDEDKSYFVFSLSCKTKIESVEENDRISYIIENILSNPFYVGQSWFRIIGDKGRIKRKLFSFSFKEYSL
jgi:hypothetical protein